MAESLNQQRTRGYRDFVKLLKSSVSEASLDEVLGLGLGAIPDATIPLGGDVLGSSWIGSVVSLLSFMKLSSLLEGRPEVGGVGKNYLRVSMLTSRGSLLKITYIDDMLGLPDDYIESYRPKER